MPANGNKDASRPTGRSRPKRRTNYPNLSFARTLQVQAAHGWPAWTDGRVMLTPFGLAALDEHGHPIQGGPG